MSMRNLIAIVEEAERLDELSRPRTRDKAEWVLIKAGYKFLGKGAYGAVYKKPDTNYVLKLFDARDQAYIEFIKLAKDNPNPHFPRFFGKPIRVTDEYYAIRTEYLKGIFGPKDEVSLLDYYISSKGQQPNSFIDEFFASQPDLKTAADLIVQLIQRHPNFVCDIYHNNVMLRGETMVLTDPISIDN